MEERVLLRLKLVAKKTEGLPLWMPQFKCLAAFVGVCEGMEAEELTRAPSKAGCLEQARACIFPAKFGRE